MENNLDLYINLLIQEKFKNENEEKALYDKILYYFNDEYLQTNYNRTPLEKLEEKHIGKIIQHDCENFKCRINFISETIQNNHNTDYTFFITYSKAFVFEEIKKSPKVTGYSLGKLKKNLIIKHIESLLEFIDDNTVAYIKYKTKTEQNILSFKNLEKLNISDLDLINNSLVRNYLCNLEQFGNDLDFTLKIPLHF